MAALGTEFKIPHGVFTSKYEKGPIVFRSFSPNSRYDHTCYFFTFSNKFLGFSLIMDQIQTRAGLVTSGSSRVIRFGTTKVYIDRSVLWMRKYTTPWEPGVKSRDIGTVAFILCDAGTGMGKNLCDHYSANAFHVDRIFQDPFWLVWTMYHNLTNWTAVFACVTRQLQLQELSAQNPEVELTRSLHNDLSVIIQFREMLR